MFDGIYHEEAVAQYAFEELGVDQLEWRSTAPGCHACVEQTNEAAAFSWRYEVGCVSQQKFYRSRKSTRSAALAEAQSLLRKLGCGLHDNCQAVDLSSRRPAATPKP